MNTILHGDALAMLKSLPDDIVQCVITSPPYYGLRDYGIEGQIGLEETPVEYIQKLVEVFREVRRVLRPDGTLWLNIGDSYASQAGPQVDDSLDAEGRQKGAWNGKSRRPANGFKPKDLMMIPARVAIALQDDGWYARSDIIWHKPSCMPESVTDRPTSSYEHVFLLAKSERYYYDADAIREPHTTANLEYEIRKLSKLGNKIKHEKLNVEKYQEEGDLHLFHPLGRNKRNVWSIPTQPFNGAHFAVMPPKLVEPCILAGSRPCDIVLDPFCGAGTVPLVALQHNRQYLGIELNPEYIKLIEKRIAVVQPTLWDRENVS